MHGSHLELWPEFFSLVSLPVAKQPSLQRLSILFQLNMDIPIKLGTPQSIHNIAYARLHYNFKDGSRYFRD